MIFSSSPAPRSPPPADPSRGALIDGLSPTIHEAVARIAARTLEKGKIPAMFGIHAAHARSIADQGYRLVTIGTDGLYISKGCNDLIEAAGG